MTAPTPDAAWKNPSYAWRTGSSSARSSQRRHRSAAWRSPATATMLMPGIHIGELFIWREDREGDDGSGIATEDDDDTDVEAGGRCAILGGGPPLTLGRAFREEEDVNKDDGDEQG